MTSDMQSNNLQILYQDEHLVAINKPSGLLVHRSEIDRHETQFAMQMTRDQIGQHVFPVHRLDKPTSGVLLFALDRDTARLLTEQFTAGTISKTYLAVVRGYTDDQGIIDYPLKEELDKMTDALANKDKPAQEAVTHYRRRAITELPYPVGRYQTARYSLLELHPKTGRKHQLRRHLKHIFHPILGDTSYGDGKHNALGRAQFGCHRLMLHAASLSLTHPVTQQDITLEATQQPSFSQTLRALHLH